MAASPAVANDVAELLVFLARVLGSERALTGVLAGLGPEVVGAALEQGEPSRFSMQTRDDLRADPVLCTTCAGHVLLAVANVAALVVLVLLLRGRLPGRPFLARANRR
jgi:hypothetical protein